MFFFTFCYNIFRTSYYLEILKNPYHLHLCNFLHFCYFFCTSCQLSLKFQLPPDFAKCEQVCLFFQSDSFLKPDFTSSIVPQNISAICEKFCTFFPLYYLFFRIFSSEYCSLVVKVSFVLCFFGSFVLSFR